MKTQNFQDLQVWQKSKELTIAIYGIFKENKDYGFRDQIQRATISIMNNLAEGHGRSGSNEFRHFVSIAKGSANEVQSMLIIARELSYISNGQYFVLESNTTEIIRMLSGLYKSL